MRAPSTLQSYLATQYSQGRHDSEGMFTLSAERALAKIAENALPFESAWILKVIQGAVAARVEGINIFLLLSSTEIELQGVCPWTPDEIVYQLQQLEPSTTPGLDYLVAALRDRLKEERQMLFLFEGMPQALFWDGDELRQHPVEDIPTRTVITVQTATSSGGSFDPATMAILGGQNALVSQTISDNAFLCPIPLRVDSRRVDQLSHVLQDGSVFEVPVTQGWLRDSTHKLSLSPRAEVSANENLPKALQVYPAHLGTHAHLLEGVPWVVRARYKSIEKTVKGETVRVWEPDKGLSTLNFVKHGILVDQQSLWDIPQPHHVSLHIYLDAGDLQHDLTGFALVEGEARDAATLRGRELAAQMLESREKLELPEDSTFPSAPWGDWLMRLLFGVGQAELLSSPEGRRKKLEKAYASLRATVNQ